MTLLLCTRNRTATLRRALATIEALEVPNSFELVVVDNGSTDATPEVLAHFAARAPFSVVIVNETRPGLGNARNAGLAHATNEIVCCTDDDCLLGVDHILSVSRSFARFADYGVAFIGGRILQGPSGGARVALLEAAELRFFPAGSVLWPGAVQGANISFRVAALRAIGGFDGRMGAGTAFRVEDLDGAARLLQAGGAGVLDPNLVVHHDHRRGPLRARRLEAANARGRGAFVAARVGGGDRRYGRSWLEQATARIGRRPDHVLRACATTSQELFGAAHWALLRAFSR